MLVLGGARADRFLIRSIDLFSSAWSPRNRTHALFLYAVSMEAKRSRSCFGKGVLLVGSLASIGGNGFFFSFFSFRFFSFLFFSCLSFILF